MRPINRNRLGPLTAATLLLLLPYLIGAAEPPSENDVRAALVYNAAKFVSWPAADAGDDDELDLCVYADETMYKAFVKLSGRTVRSRPLSVQWTDPRTISTVSCEILYVDEDMDDRPSSLSQLQSLPVLTIGESQGFASDHGVMALVLRSNRFQFVINRDAANQSGLKLGSQLLALAEILQAKNKEAK